jgi:hypothetical protein
MKVIRNFVAASLVACLLAGASASAGVFDPECTPEKAAKGAAMKATVGVGGRCKPCETVKDSTKRAVGSDEEKRDDRGIAKKTGDKVKDD